MTYRVTTLNVRQADNTIAQLRGKELDILELFNNAIPVFDREESGVSFIGRFVPPAYNEEIVTSYVSIADIRKKAEKLGVKLWLEPQCTLDGRIIPNSGLKGAPLDIANEVISR